LSPFRNADPAEEHQNAIPLSVISELGKKTILDLSTAVFELTGLRISFACRSCEYLKVSAAEQRRTKILSLQNIQCFKEGRLLAHDHDELDLRNGKKKDEKMDTITQMASGNVTLFQVCLAASIVQ
jgi:hypothetical protein